MATSGKGTGIVGYNVQTAVDVEHHLIVAHEVTNVGHDRTQLVPIALKAQEATVLLATDGELPRVEIEAALGRAEELVALVEGRSLSPRVLELRGRLAVALGDTPASERTLREALVLYRETGATGHAQRLALEIQPTSRHGKEP
jgi:hypothetical protein